VPVGGCGDIRYVARGLAVGVNGGCPWPRARGRAFYELAALTASAQEAAELDWPFRVLGDSLGVGLVYDLPEAMWQAQRHHLDARQIGFDERFEAALKNLRRVSEHRLDPVAKGLWASPWRDNHDPSRMPLRDLVRQHDLAGDPVVMVPNRDTLLLAGDDDEEALKERHEKARKDVFVAAFSLVQEKATGAVRSYCVWSEGVVTKACGPDRPAREGDRAPEDHPEVEGHATRSAASLIHVAGVGSLFVLAGRRISVSSTARRTLAGHRRRRRRNESGHRFLVKPLPWHLRGAKLSGWRRARGPEEDHQGKIGLRLVSQVGCRDGTARRGPYDPPARPPFARLATEEGGGSRAAPLRHRPARSETRPCAA
jgi:hypothetical protein